MTKMTRVAILAAEDGLASTIVGPVEILRFTGAADRLLEGRQPRPRFRVTLASADGGPIRCVGGLTLPADTCHQAALRAQPDVVLLLSSRIDAGGPMPWETALQRPLRAAHAAGATVAAICSGVFVLGRAGLLDGRMATTHWAFGTLLQKQFPAAQVRSNQMITDDGGVICGGGVNAANDLALHLVETFCGRDQARRIANALVLSLPRAAQSQYASWFIGYDSDDDAVRQAQQAIAAAPERPHTLEGLARSVGLTPRTLARRFKATTGETVIQCVQRLRVARAREILENEPIAVEQVAYRVGYEDTAFFRQVFTRLVGQPPRAYRHRHAARP